MIRNYLTVAIRSAMRHKGYAAISLGSLVIGLTCVLLIMLSIRYEMSYDAFRPSADRVYRIVKKEWNDRGHIEWRGVRDMILDIFTCGNMKRDKADLCRS